MGFFFVDESKHPAAGFSLASAVYASADPTAAVDEVLKCHGLRPGVDEYKSSRRIENPASHSAMRAALLKIVADCRLGVAVVREPSELGPGALVLLQKMLRHPKLQAPDHLAFFDEGLFDSVHHAQAASRLTPSLDASALHFEQTSSVVRGIQLADLTAHHCATMLRQRLGLVSKIVVLGEDSGYDDESFPLRFELWADLRYSFLAVPVMDPGCDPEIYDAATFGLYVSPTVSPLVQQAAMKEFGEVYMACIH